MRARRPDTRTTVFLALVELLLDSASDSLCRIENKMLKLSTRSLVKVFWMFYGASLFVPQAKIQPMPLENVQNKRFKNKNLDFSSFIGSRS